MENREVVKIVNPKQALMYAKNGLQPIKVFYSNGKFVYVFDKEESKPYFSKWLNHELH